MSRNTIMAGMLVSVCYHMYDIIVYYMQKDTSSEKQCDNGDMG